jgi:hypothetical protein
MEDTKTEEEAKEYEEMRENVLKGARELLEYSKKMSNQDPFPTALIETNRLEKEFF